MKNKKLNQLVRLYALRGFIFGLIVALVTLLLAADSNVYHDSERTVSDFIRLFPGVWVIIFFPLLCAGAGYFLAYKMSGIIRQQNKQMKEDEKRSSDILTIVEALGQGNYEEFDGRDKHSENDELILSLNELRKTLSKNKDEEIKRRKEEEQRTWVTNGVAQFGEILRRNQDNMEELSYTVVRYLVDYMKINQAGFFILNKDDEEHKFFEMTGHVAFDRKKFTDKKILWGEGIIGRCGLEK